MAIDTAALEAALSGAVAVDRHPAQEVQLDINFEEPGNLLLGPGRVIYLCLKTVVLLI